MLSKFKGKVEKAFSEKKAPTPVAMRKYKSYKRIRWACRSFVTGAIGTSIWANALFAAHNVAAIIFLALPSVFVWAGLELISRVRVNSSWLRKFARPTATLALCAIAAWLSYWTQSKAIAQYLPDEDHARLLPIAIDGFMVIASVTLAEVNDLIEQIELAMESAAGAARRLATPKVEKKTLRGNKRTRFVQALSANPQATAGELAAMAGVSTSYAHMLRKELVGEVV